MPTVPAPRQPYSPTPEVQQQQIGTPNLRIDTPVAAFGGASAAATEGLGQAESSAGNELFQRAVALQQLDNVAQANDTSIAVGQKLGQLRDQYLTTQGVNAKDALPAYQDAVAKVRQDALASTSNPMVRQFLDRDVTSKITRDLDYAGLHAATEFKHYVIGTSAAKVHSLADDALANPGDQQAFLGSVEDTKAQIQHQGDLQGWGPDQVADATSKAVSNLWIKRVEGLARVQPFAADKMLKQALADGSIRGEQQEAAIQFVRSQTRTVGARNISHEISSGSDLYWGSKPVDLQAAKDAIGGFESGNNYTKVGPETAHGRALGKYQVMEQFLPDYLSRAGLPPMTPQEFLANHDAQEQVFARTFGADMQKYGSFNEAASRWLTGKGVAEAQASGVKDAFGTDVNAYLRNTNAILARGASLSDRVQRSTQMASDLAPDDPLMQDYARARVEQDFSQQHRIKLEDDFANRQTIESGLMGGQNGKIPTNLDELKAALPGADQAWAHLDPSVQRRYLAVLAKNSKGDTSWTTDGLERYQTLKGMAQSDPQDFLGISPAEESKLPFSARKELINLQQRMKANAEGDPRVTKALGILAPDLNAAGITKTADKDRYYQFVGSLQDAIGDFQQDNKRLPKAEDIQLIGRRLMQEQHTHWWQSSQGMFEVPVPDDEAQRIAAQPAWKSLGIVPTAQQIQRIYTRELYQKLYGGTAKKAEADEPQVPMSQ